MFNKKQFIAVAFFLFIGCQNAVSQQINQIIRQQDKLNREDILTNQELERLYYRKKARSAKDEMIIYLHPPILCAEKNLSYLDKITPSSYITVQDMIDSPVTFFMVIEIIKSHLDISNGLYKKGKFIFSNAMRYHAPEELKHYPDDIIKNGVYDLFKSIYYIRYVLVKMIKPFMAKQDYTDVIDILSFLQDPPANYTHYRFYNEATSDIKEILEGLFEKHYQLLPKHSFSMKQIKILAAMRLWQESWLSYQKTTSCTFHTKIINPFIDSYEMDLPSYHDSYLTGYGFYKRAEFLTQSIIMGDPALTAEERKAFMKLMLVYQKIYADIIHESDTKTSLSEIANILEKTKLIAKNRFF